MGKINLFLSAMLFSKWINGAPKVFLYWAVSSIKWNWSIRYLEGKFNKIILTSFILWPRLCFVPRLEIIHNQIKLYKWDGALCLALFLFIMSVLDSAFIHIYLRNRKVTDVSLSMPLSKCPLRLSWHQMLSTNPSPAFIPLWDVMLQHSVAAHTYEHGLQCLKHWSCLRSQKQRLS